MGKTSSYWKTPLSLAMSIECLKTLNPDPEMMPFRPHIEVLSEDFERETHLN